MSLKTFLAAGRYRVETTLDGFETDARRVILAAGQSATSDVTVAPARFTQSVVVTARRVEELAQEVPIPVSVVRGDLIATAGAINVTTRKPSFTPGTEVELNYGNLGFVQAKASVTGPLGSNRLAGRLSFSGTQRDGTLLNTRTLDDVNDLNNLGVRGQVLFAPSGSVAVTVTGDHTRQRPEGFTQVVAGVVPTLRAANRQYAQIAAGLGYAPPSFNAFDRLTDVDHGLALLGLEALERS